MPEIWWDYTLTCTNDDVKMQVGEAIHKQLAGNEDYVNNHIILNVDEPCKVKMWVLDGTALPDLMLPAFTPEGKAIMYGPWVFKPGAEPPTGIQPFSIEFGVIEGGESNA